MSFNSRTIELLRIGNPWMVGHNVNRVVPVYVLHNFIAPNAKHSIRLQDFKNLAFDAARAMKALGDKIEASQDNFDLLEQTTFGLISPERRIFRAREGGASQEGSPFPLTIGMVRRTPSDDRLGVRVRELMETRKGDWRKKLERLMNPVDAKDPATAFALKVLGGDLGDFDSSVVVESDDDPTLLDKYCAAFLDRILVDHSDARRIPSIRRFALAAYFVAIIRLVAGPAVNEGDERPPKVFVYGGLPPGRALDPLIQAAGKSYTFWVSQSWKSIASRMHSELKSVRVLPRSSESEKLSQKVTGALRSRQLSDEQISSIMESLSGLISNQSLSEDWCRELLESDVVGLLKSEYARRVRSLSQNVGFAGPDRGGKPRLFLDTPLLGMLVQGIVTGTSMEFEEFVTELANRFGLVVGLGSDDSISEEISGCGLEGADTYELLSRNQDLLRERLVRAGLARSYSDSHTEVVKHA